MSEEFAPPQPTVEHQRLKEACGTWKVQCTYFMGPDQPPMENQATEKIEMFGPFFTVSKFESQMFGAPFIGSCTMGYEPQAKRWVATWCDSFMPNLFYMTGKFDKSGEVLTMTGEGVDCQSGKITKYRSVEKAIDPNKREFDMFMTQPDSGQEIQMFHYVYERA